jgi:sulfatase modifying factor 1
MRRQARRSSRPGALACLLMGIIGPAFGAAPSDPSAKPLRLVGPLTKWQADPVLDVGPAGRWDEGRCGCFTVSRVGEEFFLWYMGSGKSGSWRIGLAKSPDGVRWLRFGDKPVLTAGAKGQWDDKQVSMPYVLKDGGTFHMWYCGAGATGGGFGLATSSDGAQWKRHGTGPVLRGTGGSFDPCVRKMDGRFEMWYCGRAGGAYRIMHATSPDGIKWSKSPGPVLPLGAKGSFDSGHHAGPCVLRIGNVYYLWHLGSDGTKWRMGLATSRDGRAWSKWPDSPVLDVGEKGAWDSGSILGHDVLYVDGVLHVWYAAVADADVGKPENRQAIRIGYARLAPAAPATAICPLEADRVRAIQKSWAAHLGGQVTEANSVGMSMVLVPPGEYTMGTSQEQLDALIKLFSREKWWYPGAASMWGFEVPAHRVRITRPFRIGATEVTVAQFRAFTKASGYKTEAEESWFRGKPSQKKGFPKHTWRSVGYKQKDDEPVVHISWNDATAFCRWLAEKEGRDVRLPTEAEWEYACRAGTATRWACGDEFKKAAAEFAWIEGDRPRPVGKKKPNAFGLHDMHGNVWEYCSDWWRWDHKAGAAAGRVAVDPPGPTTMPDGRPLRPLRGGSFDFGASSRSACRVRVHQTTHRFRHLGFRVAMSITAGAAAGPKSPR